LYHLTFGEDSFGGKNPLRKLEEQLAETSARYSDPRVELRANVTSARSALSFLLICSWFGNEPWRTEVLIKTIAQAAFAARYAGKWKLVQTLLELEPESFNPETVIATLLAQVSPYEFYGNLVNDALAFYRSIQFRDTTKHPSRRVRRPQFRRGYRDKGSRRLPHEQPVDPPTRPPLTDRRHKVHCNPLLELRRAEDSLSEDWPEATSAANEGGASP